jgi:hypothetical protein
MIMYSFLIVHPSFYLYPKTEHSIRLGWLAQVLRQPLLHSQYPPQKKRNFRIHCRNCSAAQGVIQEMSRNEMSNKRNRCLPLAVKEHM